MWSGKPVTEEIAARLPILLEIAVMATVVASSSQSRSAPSRR